MAERHYIAVRFKHNPRRTYTYHHDKGPIPVGALVQVATPRDGLKSVEVVTCDTRQPLFATKPISGILKLPEPQPAQPVTQLPDGLEPENDA